jgi:hypothetical protein
MTGTETDKAGEFWVNCQPEASERGCPKNNQFSCHYSFTVCQSGTDWEVLMALVAEGSRSRKGGVVLRR